MTSTETWALRSAAEAALRAPSIFNTQPWRWRVTTADTLELSVDPQRRLPHVDPDGRLTTLSCGAALHHARVALAAEGRTSRVDRFPDPQRPDLLARLSVAGHHAQRPAEVRMFQATLVRRTDRRLFAEHPVPAEALDRLRQAAQAEHAHLHLLRPDDVLTLAAAVTKAQELELADPAYREELARWTARPDGDGDGVPADTATGPAHRTVPVRDFSLRGTGELEPGAGTDRAARFAVLAADGDEPLDWLRAGEALSAVLLTAVDAGLAVSPMSDVTEVPGTRQLLRGVLSGIGYPLLVLRVGFADPDRTLPAAHRRDPSEVITVEH